MHNRNETICMYIYIRIRVLMNNVSEIMVAEWPKCPIESYQLDIHVLIYTISVADFWLTSSYVFFFVVGRIRGSNAIYSSNIRNNVSDCIMPKTVVNSSMLVNIWNKHVED